MSSEADKQLRALSAIASATPDAIISVNQDQLISFANPAAMQMFRCTSDAMLNAPLERFIPERFRRDHRRHIAVFGESGVTVRKMAGSLTVMGLRADNSEFPLEASISQVEIEGVTVYTVILRDVTLRVQTDEELERTRTRLRLLTARLRTVREDEQRHVARELHDDIGQRLSALKMDVAALRNDLPAEYPKLFDLVENMDELVTATVGAVRNLATGLRPKILDDLGLAPALESFLHDIQSRFRIDCELDIDDTQTVSEEQSIAVFRIVQEAVHNVAKHANASWIRVAFGPDGEHWLLTVRDNGRGMTQKDEEKEGSLGLIGIRERIASLSGAMAIHSAPGRGTTIECTLPRTNGAPPPRNG